jgi:uncharacterized protein with PQ loop repeat
MIASSHNAVGFTLGYSIVKNVQDPILGMILSILGGVITHYLFDAMPHGHFTKVGITKKLSKINIFIFSDLIFSFLLFVVYAILIFGFGNDFIIIFLAMVASQIPDIINSGIPFLRKGYQNKVFSLDTKIHNMMHWHGLGVDTLLIGWTDIWQLALIMVALLIPTLWPI